MKLEMDHIVVAAERLEDGVAYVEDVLGVKMAPGGKHPLMGTHNQLLGLGECYLEVISIDPEAASSDRPRWFDLDNFSGAPRLTNWVAKVPDLPGGIALAPPGSGTPTLMTRGDLSWHIAMSEDGKLPFDGAFPGLISWGDTPHPSSRLPDASCSLASWEISHSDKTGLRAAFDAFDTPFGGMIVSGPKGFRAEIQTPKGVKTLT